MTPTPTPPPDLFAPEVIADPYGYFGHLRDTDPVHWNAQFRMWLVTGHLEVAWILRRHDLFSSAVIRNDQAPAYPPVDPADLPLFDDIRAFRSAQLVEKDRPVHLRQRSVVHSYFTPTAMERWRPFVRRAVDELLDRIQGRASGAHSGAMDVLDELAAPLPVRVIAEMMGVPYRDRDRLRAMADGILYINRGEARRLRPLARAIREIVEYATPLAEERSRGDGRDFISVLANGETAGAFTRHEVLVNTGLLLFAGHETTMNLICNGLLAFIRHPDQWERLRADPAGMARLATEECLRFDPPVKSTQRVATADVPVADIVQRAVGSTADGGPEAGGRGLGAAPGGRRRRLIRKGDRIRWIIAAANRDPRTFDRPDDFDIGRQPNPHVSFGAGIHYCLGAALARIEGQEVFRGLAERFSRFELDGGPVEYQPSLQFRSVKSLPVKWWA